MVEEKCSELHAKNEKHSEGKAKLANKDKGEQEISKALGA